MCGIFASQLPGETQEMLARMKHRGPDAQSSVYAGGFSVGLARLAIVAVDAPEATQPYVSTQGRIIAFNGEIYNYKALDDRAASEVELLARMLDEHCDPRQFIDGEYAILYYNPSQRTVTLYRDRFGICPLYYQLRPHVAISSERRRLERPIDVPAHGKVLIDLDTRNVIELDRILHYGVTIEKTPGHENRNVFQALFEQAVASRASHTDAGFSMVLSGGLDSSAIAYGLRYHRRPREAICVTLDVDSGDARHARMVADDLKLDLKVIKVSRDELHADAPAILQHLDGHTVEITPLKWRASVRNWYAAKACTTKVLLCGEGADELFEGYPPHTYSLRPMYRLAQRQLTAIRSLPAINLDRTNKLGLAHSKEYRCPFLASTLSYWLLSQQPRPPKELLRDYLRRHHAPQSLIDRPKWGDDEVALDKTWSEINAANPAT